MGLRKLKTGQLPTRLPPERWAPFPDGGTLFVRRPQLKPDDIIRLSDMTTIDVPPGHYVVVLSAAEVEGR
jgi:hypothetical protein